VDLANILSRTHKVLSENNYSPNMNWIVNYAGCVVQISAVEFRNLVRIVSAASSRPGSFKEAIVIDRTHLQALASMFETTASTPGVTYRIFNLSNPDSSADLRSWMSLPGSFEFPEFMEIP
jgi:hypothetical protein